MGLPDQMVEKVLR